MTLRGVDGSIDQTDTYEKVYKELYLNLPSFYFSVQPKHFAQTSNVIADKKNRELFNRLLAEGYFATNAMQAVDFIKSEKEKADSLKDADRVIELNRIYNLPEPQLNSEIAVALDQSKQAVIVPKVFWNGTQNQYHKWLGSVFKNEFGVSFVDGRTALSKVKKAMTWTLSITLIDFILSTVCGVFIGMFLVKNPDGKLQKICGQILYFIYSIPIFWLATLMVVYFTTDDYGSLTNIFPSVALDIYPGKSTLQQILLNADKLILPICILTIHSLAYLTRFVRRSLLDELKKPYVSLAYSKGLSKSEVIKKHALKNALTPLITTMASAFAGAFGGSLVIEVIFNIPGMGRLLINAIGQADWNVVFCITMVASFVTIISYIIADFFYAYTNPKIKFSKNNN